MHIIIYVIIFQTQKMKISKKFSFSHFSFHCVYDSSGGANRLERVEIMIRLVLTYIS